MCYICEARGTVGANYRAAQKEIGAALRVDRWLNAPASARRLWTNKDLKEYGREWRRNRLSPQRGTEEYEMAERQRANKDATPGRKGMT